MSSPFAPKKSLDYGFSKVTLPTAHVSAAASALQLGLYAVVLVVGYFQHPHEEPTALGQRQYIFSLFDVLDQHRYPLRSMYMVGVALVLALKSVVLAFFSLSILSLFSNSTYGRVGPSTKLLVVVLWLKHVAWISANMIGVSDSQMAQLVSFFGFLVMGNIALFVGIFVVLAQNIALFNILVKSSSFNRGSLTYKKVFNLNGYFLGDIWPATRHWDYVRYAKILYAGYTVLQIYLFSRYYYHQIANDLVYLDWFNVSSWLALTYDVVLESFVLGILGLGGLGIKDTMLLVADRLLRKPRI